MSSAPDALPRAVAAGTVPRLSVGFWGLLTAVLTEASLFGYLLFSDGYLAAQAQGAWPPSGPPKLLLASINTLVLLGSSAVLIWAEKGLRRNERARAALGTVVALVMGAVFMTLQFIEWHNKPFSFSTDVYSSIYFTTTGFHMAHVAAGLIGLAMIAAWTWMGIIHVNNRTPFRVASLYWHFVDAVWLVVFTAFYLLPYLR